MMDGHLIPFEMVVGGLEKDTISYNIGGGSRLGDFEGVAIQFQVEPQKYEKTIEAIKTLMFDSVFDITRLNAALQKSWPIFQKLREAETAWLTPSTPCSTLTVAPRSRHATLSSRART